MLLASAISIPSASAAEAFGNSDFMSAAKGEGIIHELSECVGELAGSKLYQGNPRSYSELLRTANSALQFMARKYDKLLISFSDISSDAETAMREKLMANPMDAANVAAAARARCLAGIEAARGLFDEDQEQARLVREREAEAKREAERAIEIAAERERIAAVERLAEARRKAEAEEARARAEEETERLKLKAEIFEREEEARRRTLLAVARETRETIRAGIGAQALADATRIEAGAGAAERIIAAEGRADVSRIGATGSALSNLEDARRKTVEATASVAERVIAAQGQADVSRIQATGAAVSVAEDARRKTLVAGAGAASEVIASSAEAAVKINAMRPNPASAHPSTSVATQPRFAPPSKADLRGCRHAAELIESWPAALRQGDAAFTMVSKRDINKISGVAFIPAAFSEEIATRLLSGGSAKRQSYRLITNEDVYDHCLQFASRAATN